MDTKIYEYIIAVVEQKSITKAAEQCFISQPALTQHIKKLEEEFGFPLFEKKSTGQYPTKEGEIFLTTARRILQIEKEIYEKIGQCQKNEIQAFRVFIDAHLRILFVESIWPRFLAEYPDTTLTLTSGSTDSAIEYMDAQLIDVAIFPTNKAPPPRIDYIPIDQNEYQLILPPGHPLCDLFAKYRIDFSRLKQETFIVNRNYSFFGEIQQQILERYGFTPAHTIRVHSMQKVVQMVSQGQGFSLLPDIMLGLIPNDCVHFSLDPPWVFDHVLAFYKNQGLTTQYALLANLLMEHYRKLHQN